MNILTKTLFLRSWLKFAGNTFCNTKINTLYTAFVINTIMIIGWCLLSPANTQTKKQKMIGWCSSYLCFIINNPKLRTLKQQLIISHDTVD